MSGPISRRWQVIRLIVIWLLAVSASAKAEFRVGVAARSIIPKPLLPLSGGMGPSSPAKAVRGDLSARALVMQSGEIKVAIVSVDVLGFPAVLGNRARAQIKNIPPTHVVIGASHTHSAPDCYAFPDGQGGHTGDLRYMEMVCDRIVEAVNEADGNLRDAQLRIATGKVEGRVAYNYYAPDLYDRRASVIQAVDTLDKPMVTLVNYAVHPEVLGAASGICSPDLVGPLRDHIEQSVGGMAMFMNGAQGGMVTADNRDLDRPSDAQRGYWNDRRTWEECIRIGTTLGQESLRIINQSPAQADPKLRCLVAQARFPVDSDELWSVVQHSPLKYPHNDDRSITSQLNLIELGSARILTIPGEALPNIGFYLKRKMGGRHNLLFGLTNDAFGYILTKEDFMSFERYEYISRVSLGEGTGDILVEQALELVKRVK